MPTNQKPNIRSEKEALKRNVTLFVRDAVREFKRKKTDACMGYAPEKLMNTSGAPRLQEPHVTGTPWRICVNDRLVPGANIHEKRCSNAEPAATEGTKI